MLLLTTLMADSLDEGYARAAARRRAGASPPRRTGLLFAAGALVVGLLLATAAVQARERSSAADAAHAALVAEIRDRTAAADRLQRRLEQVRSDVSTAQREALRLTGEGAALATTLATLEAATGGGPVTGPGMRVRLDDAEVPADSDGDPRTGDPAEGRVTDRDLQTVVNEVWASGAEAVAVNGQRLTALAAIRAAGEAILVDFRPLAPPYEILAVGPPAMRVRFADGFGGSYLQVLRDYGITSAVEEAERLRLPASAALTLRHATAPDTVGSAAEPTREEER